MAYILNSCFISFTLKFNIANLLNLYKRLDNVSRSAFEPTQRSKMELFCENKHFKLIREITLKSRIFTKTLHHICMAGFSIHLYGIQFWIARALRLHLLARKNRSIISLVAIKILKLCSSSESSKRSPVFNLEHR